VLHDNAQAYDLAFFGPGGSYLPLALPASVTFTTDATVTPLFFELRLDQGVGVEACAWGGVKARFR